jgi:hypothetical protein
VFVDDLTCLGLELGLLGVVGVATRVGRDPRSWPGSRGRFSHLTTCIAAARGLSTAEPIAPAEGIPLLKVATEDRAARWEPVLLLGDTATIAAARQWHDCVWRLEWFARGKLAGQSEYDQAMRETEQARDEFYRCARRDLGIAGVVPSPSWPPKWVPPVAGTGASETATSEGPADSIG